jgi:hypothetical protein
MPKSRKPVRAKTTSSRTKSKPARTAKKPAAKKPATGGLWLGTGLCPEAQGDGLPCRGVEGECERCGRALTRVASS